MLSYHQVWPLRNDVGTHCKVRPRKLLVACLVAMAILLLYAGGWFIFIIRYPHFLLNFINLELASFHWGHVGFNSMVDQAATARFATAKCIPMLASYPGFLTLAFVACSTNALEGLVKLCYV